MTGLAPTPAHRDPDVVNAAIAALAGLRAQTALTVALMLTDDGFEIARHPRAEAQDQRLASMASSLQALGEAIIRELHLGDSRSMLLAADDGHTLLLRVPGQAIVLAAVFKAEETVGAALAATRAAANAFAKQLELRGSAAIGHDTEFDASS